MSDNLWGKIYGHTFFEKVANTFRRSSELFIPKNIESFCLTGITLCH